MKQNKRTFEKFLSDGSYLLGTVIEDIRKGDLECAKDSLSVMINDMDRALAALNDVKKAP